MASGINTTHLLPCFSLGMLLLMLKDLLPVSGKDTTRQALRQLQLGSFAPSSNQPYALNTDILVFL